MPPRPPPASTRNTGDLPRVVVPGPVDASVLEPASTGDLVIRGHSETLIVELMSDGRLRAPRERTRQILRDAMARAEVLPTGPGWVVLRTLGNEAPPSSRERAEAEREVVMAGTLGESSVALIDVIGFLASGLQTGALSVLSGDVERAIYVLRGDVVWASSSAVEDRIGEFLVRRGKITRSQLAEVTQSAPMRVGRACVERGLIAAHDLWKLVQDQLREIFDRILATEQGTWVFLRVSEKELSESQVIMPTQGLLMDAVRKLDEMRVYREAIRSSAAVVRRLTEDVGSAADRLPRLEPHERDMAQVVYAALPARATIQDLMRITGKGEYEITRLVYHLFRAQLVEIQSEESNAGAPRPNTGITKTQAQDVTVIYSMAIREIFEELERSGQAQDLHKAAASFLQNVSGEHAAVLRAARLTPSGTLDEGPFLQVLQGLPLTIQGLSDGLSELLFFLLFEASELLGPRRRDDLARRVKMIHGMLSLPDERPNPAEPAR